MANSKINVPVFGTVGKKVAINLNATTGATIGTDLKLPNGTVPSLAQLAAALGVAPAGAATNPNVLWQQLAEVPPNIVAVQNLATAGLVRRLPNGDWITQPPSDFQGRPGAPGRQGTRGFPGVPGVPGVAGSAGATGSSGIGIPGRRGTRGRNGFPGPAGPAGAAGAPGSAGAAGSSGIGIPGRRGTRGRNGFPGVPGTIGATGPTGPQGPAGSASSGTGFPGYRQRKPPRQRLMPWHDSAAPTIWSAPHVFSHTANTSTFVRMENLSAGNAAAVDIRALNDAGHLMSFGIACSGNVNAQWAGSGAPTGEQTYLGHSGNIPLVIGTNNTYRGQITGAGGWVIAAPATGTTALAVNGPTANNIQTWSDGTRIASVFLNSGGVQFGSVSNDPLFFFVDNGAPTLSITTTATAINYSGVAALSVATTGVNLGLPGQPYGMTGPTTTTTATGGAATLPTLPVGYFTLNINGTARKIAFFNP